MKPEPEIETLLAMSPATILEAPNVIVGVPRTVRLVLA